MAAPYAKIGVLRVRKCLQPPISAANFTKPSFYLRYQPNLELRPILIAIAIQLRPAARLTQPPHAAPLRSPLTQPSSYDAHLNEVSSILQ